MEFGLDDTQRLFERALRDFLGKHLPLEVRRLARQGNGFEEPLWRGLVELGVVGVLVPERHGVSSGSARTASSWAARSAAAGRRPPCRAGARGEVISYAPGR